MDHRAPCINNNHIQLSEDLRSFVEQANSYIQQRELEFINHLNSFEKQIHSECAKTIQVQNQIFLKQLNSATEEKKKN